MLLIDYWKDVKNYEELYSVSCCAFVRSWDRYVKRWRKGMRLLKGRILKPGLSKDGYLRLTICANNKKTTKSVHRLIAQTFIKNPNNYPQVNHKNGIKSDNRIENIEWCDQHQNAKHAVKNGLMNTSKGEKHYRAKLTKKHVKEIKLKLLQGYRLVDLAREYKVTIYSISKIKIGKNWKHVVI